MPGGGMADAGCWMLNARYRMLLSTRPLVRRREGSVLQELCYHDANVPWHLKFKRARLRRQRPRPQ